MLEFEIAVIDRGRIVARGKIQADDEDAARNDIREAEASLKPYQWLHVSDPRFQSTKLGGMK